MPDETRDPGADELLEPISKIVQLFRDPDPRVRSRAALLAGRYAAHRSFVEKRLNDHDARVRANAVESLWGLKHDFACETLARALWDSSHRVRANAGVGLHIAKDPNAREVLARESKHAASAARKAAAWAMGRTGDSQFRAILDELERDPDEGVRRAAQRAIAALKPVTDAV